MSCQTYFDACDDICLQGEVKRGAIRTTDPTAGLASDERLATFRFDLTVKNCTGHTINQFNPRLDLNSVFLAEGGAVCSPHPVTSALSVDASIGRPNGFYDGKERTQLLCHSVRLPPGCATFTVYLTDPHLNHATLQRALFSVKGHIKCESCEQDECGQQLAARCLAVNKSLALDCECLPLESEPGARRIIYVREAEGDEPVTLQGDGKTWATAYQGALGLQEAVNNAVAGEQVWVAEGEYSLTETLVVPSGVKVFGGFHVGDTALCQRSLEQEGGSKTKITTQVDLTPIEVSVGILVEPMVFFSHSDASTVFDGINLADVSGNSGSLGLITVVDAGAPRLRNFSVKNNSGLQFSFLLTGQNVAPVLCNALWEDNVGIQCVGITQIATGESDNEGLATGDSTVVNATFRRNETIQSEGSGVCLQENGGRLLMINTVIEQTVNAGPNGKAFYVADTIFEEGSTQVLTLVNLTAVDNVGGISGVIEANRASNLNTSIVNIVNSIFVNNTNTPDLRTGGGVGGVIRVRQSLFDEATPFSDPGPGEVIDLGNNKVGVSKAQAFGGNGSTAPRLAPGALSVNCGDNSVLRVGTDRDGRPRVAKGRVDLGAYELHC